MTLLICSRRALLLETAAFTIFPAGRALAQPGKRRHDWMSMIGQHHDLLERAFEELMAPDDQSYEKRFLQLRTVDQLLRAHSLAEETVIYPALALTGSLMSEAEKLYLEEAHAKIMLAQLQMASARGQASDWREPARALRDALLRHAREQEESRLFPLLQDRLNPSENRRLTREYPRVFASVLPVRP